MSKKQTLFCGNCKEYLREELIKESNKANGGTAFRIPSLVNANGVLVAAIDKAATGGDWGYIELAVRTSEDNGDTWTDIKTIASPPARVINTSMENTKTAFYIDPCMAVAANGDIILLATFFPESKGFHNFKMLDKHKAAYTMYDGKKQPIIYDRDGNYYIITDNGNVLDSKKNKTEYTVQYPQGALYKDEEYVGNIHLNGSMGKSTVEDTKTTFGAPLKMPKRSYIYMLRSKDNGKTWSEPVDITASILTDSDGVFFAVAPGSGLTTKSGRIIMPIYTKKGTVAIYSDDNGETWKRNTASPYTGNIDEWCLIEAPDSTLYSFGRARIYGKTPVSISYDNGISWIKAKKANVKAPKCQKNAMILGDRILVSHPNEKKRANGAISTGSFIKDKSGNVKGIKWDKEYIEINRGFFAYSCMCRIDDNTIGILYEDEPGSHIIFEKIVID